MYEMFCIKLSFYINELYGCCLLCVCFFFITVILHSDFFAGKRISPLAKESYNSSINYNRQKPSVIFCVQFSTFLYKCTIFDQFVNKHVQFGMDAKCSLYMYTLCFMPINYVINSLVLLKQLNSYSGDFPIY